MTITDPNISNPITNKQQEPNDRDPNLFKQTYTQYNPEQQPPQQENNPQPPQQKNSLSKTAYNPPPPPPEQNNIFKTAYNPQPSNEQSSH